MSEGLKRARKAARETHFVSIARCENCQYESTWGGRVTGGKVVYCQICQLSTYHQFTPKGKQ